MLAFLDPAKAKLALYTPLTVVPATSTAASATGQKTLASVAASPNWQAPVGGGLLPPGFEPNETTSNYASHDYIKSTWLGGDPNTGIGTDTGGYDGVGGTVTLNSAASVLSSAQKASWYSSAEADLNAGNYGQALQVTINNASWDVNNLTAPAASANYATDITAANGSWNDLGACVGAVAIGAGTIAAALATDGTVFTLPQSLVLVGSLIEAVSACSQAITDTFPGSSNGTTGTTAPPPMSTSSEDYDGTFTALEGGVQGTSFMGGNQRFFTAQEGSSGIGADALKLKPSGLTFNSQGDMTMTPGFTPSQAYLEMVEPDMTAKALATYFPHG